MINYRKVINYWGTPKDRVSQKPTLLANKDDFMSVDRKGFKNAAWEYFRMAPKKKSNWFLLGS